MNAEMKVEIVPNKVVIIKKPKKVKKVVEPVEELVVAEKVEESIVAENVEEVSSNEVVLGSVDVEAVADPILTRMAEIDTLRERLDRERAELELNHNLSVNIAEYRDRLIRNREIQIMRLRSDVKDAMDNIKLAENEIKCFREQEDEDLAKNILCVKALQRELGFDKPAEKTCRTKNNRKEQWNYIPDGTKLQMTFKNSGLIYTKISNGLIGEDGQTYKSMNDAIKKYKLSIGDNKSFGSAWKMFRVYEE